jgi:hypothetical protein
MIGQGLLLSLKQLPVSAVAHDDFGRAVKLSVPFTRFPLYSQK